MRLSVLFLLIACTACSRTEAPAADAAPATAAAAPSMPKAAMDDAAALKRIEQSKTPVSLAGLLDQAEAAQGALMEISSGEAGKALLETYDEAGFAALQAEMRGLKLHRGMDIYAQPDPQFFATLAKAHGEPADVAFFDQYAAAWGPDDVPVYLKLRPQPTPCVRFGEDRILPLYRGWQQFRSAYPAAYADRTAQQLADLEEVVTLGTCACDGIDSVLREQKTFLEAYPDHAKAGEIKARGAQLRNDPDAMPVNCR